MGAVELIKGMRLGPVCGRKEGADAVDGLAHRLRWTPLLRQHEG